jgi:hypothetical protein
MLQHNLDGYLAKWIAFGWNAMSIDGHNVDEIKAALDKARATKGKPTAIVARTFKGRGVTFLEDKDNWHGKPLKKGEELNKALAEIGDPKITIPVASRFADGAAPSRNGSFSVDAPELAPELRSGRRGGDPRGVRRRAGEARQGQSRTSWGLDARSRTRPSPTSSRRRIPTGSSTATSPSRTWPASRSGSRPRARSRSRRRSPAS